MTCMEAQALITPFINDKLDHEQLEEFLKHVRECPECMEELEVYFALLTAMKQLDEDDEVSGNFKQELENKLKESEEQLLRIKLVHIRKRILFFVVVLLIGILSSWSVDVVEQVIQQNKEREFNEFVIENEVFAQHIQHPLIGAMKDYEEVLLEAEEYEAMKVAAANSELDAYEHKMRTRRTYAKKVMEHSFTYPIQKYGIDPEVESALNQVRRIRSKE